MAAARPLTGRGQETAGPPPGAERGLLAADRVVAVYLGVTGLLVLARGLGAGDAGVIPVVLRVVFFGFINIVRDRGVPASGLIGFLRRAYPAALYPYFYWELGVLNGLVTSSLFDDAIVGWERAVFRSMPSVELRGWLPWSPLAEFLHLGYLTYYLMVPLVVVSLWLRRRLRALGESVTTITLTFIACYAFFILMPVAGPFHHLTPPDPHALGRIFPPLVHDILHRGSSVGTAFPSSHVAIAVAALIQAVRHDRVSAAVLWVLVPAMTLGAVYGGFHYAIDASAGLVLALVMNPLGRWVWRRWEPERVV